MMTEAEKLYYDSMGCGCCTYGDEPSWSDIEKALREQIAQEIEDYRVERCRCEQNLEKDCDALIKAVNIARGQK